MKSFSLFAIVVMLIVYSLYGCGTVNMRKGDFELSYSGLGNKEFENVEISTDGENLKASLGSFVSESELAEIIKELKEIVSVLRPMEPEVP